MDPKLVGNYSGIAIATFISGCFFYLLFYKRDRVGKDPPKKPFSQYNNSHFVFDTQRKPRTLLARGLDTIVPRRSRRIYPSIPTKNRAVVQLLTYREKGITNTRIYEYTNIYIRWGLYVYE